MSRCERVVSTQRSGQSVSSKSSWSRYVGSIAGWLSVGQIAEFKVGIVLQQRIPVLVNLIIHMVFNGFCSWADPETNLTHAKRLGSAHIQLARARCGCNAAGQ